MSKLFTLSSSLRNNDKKEQVKQHYHLPQCLVWHRGSGRTARMNEQMNESVRLMTAEALLPAQVFTSYYSPILQMRRLSSERSNNVLKVMEN